MWIATSKTRRYAAADYRYPIADWWYAQRGIFNTALENASAEASNDNKIFSPQNWIKAKASLKDTRSAIRTFLQSLKYLPGGVEVVKNLSD